MTRFVILVASVFEISCENTDRQTDKRRQKPFPMTAVDAGLLSTLEAGCVQ